MGSNKKKYPKLYRKWKVRHNYTLIIGRCLELVLMLSFTAILIKLLGFDSREIRLFCIALFTVSTLLVFLQLPCVVLSNEEKTLIHLGAVLDFMMNFAQEGLEVKNDGTVEFFMENYSAAAETMNSGCKYVLICSDGEYIVSHTPEPIINAIITGSPYVIENNTLTVKIPTIERINWKISNCDELVTEIDEVVHSDKERKDKVEEIYELLMCMKNTLCA